MNKHRDSLFVAVLQEAVEPLLHYGMPAFEAAGDHWKRGLNEKLKMDRPEQMRDEQMLLVVMIGMDPPRTRQGSEVALSRRLLSS